MSDAQLIIDGSGRVGQVGLAVGNILVQSAALDDTRRHARDLGTTISRLLKLERLLPSQIRRVVVSIGPGGYTGLRVGITTAKIFAYATGCELVAVPTFHAIVQDAAPEPGGWVVLADALQGNVYVQEFDADRRPCGPLRIELLEQMKFETRTALGPGVAVHVSKLVNVKCGSSTWPSLDATLIVAQHLSPISRDELFALEPLYLRGSSAEELAKQRAKKTLDDETLSR